MSVIIREACGENELRRQEVRPVGEFEMIASSLNGVLGQSDFSHGGGMDQLVGACLTS
jgi:hypothetical protein